MNITYSVKGVAKAVGVFLLLLAASALVITGAAMAVDAAMPGKNYGASLKGLFRPA